MLSIRRLLLLLVLCLPFFATDVRAQAKKREPPPDVPMQQWLAGPDRTDIPAEFKVLNPRFTFQQRYLVECRSSISGEIARGRELHIWLNVADHAGSWQAGSTYIRQDASPALTKHNEIQFVGAFYALPGQYTVAIVIYDGKSHQYDVRHMPVTVKPIENDPLAGRVETASPAVEFLDDPPPNGTSFQKISDYNKDVSDSLWPFAHVVDTFPLNSMRPLQIDVVLNLSDAGDVVEIPPSILPRLRRSPDFDPRLMAPPPREVKMQQRQKEYIGALLATAKVLAAIHPANGCVRVNAIDVMNMEVAIRRMSADGVEWEKVRNYRTTSKLAEVSLTALKNRKEQPNFVREFLSGLQAPIEKCGTGAGAPLHAVIFVSQSYVFPSGSKKENFKSSDPGFQFFYYRLDVATKNIYDDLGSYLKSNGAKTYDLYGPRDLRDAMARTLSDISHSSTAK